LPPIGAKVVPTACDYCVVGCGYLAYTWPVGDDGGPKASENALGADFPVSVLSGNWISTNMHTIVDIDGRPNNVVVIPDSSIKVVNIGGDHSVRGGAPSPKNCTAMTGPQETGSSGLSFAWTAGLFPSLGMPP
jgi:arsenite oxidase large subunit